MPRFVQSASRVRWTAARRAFARATAAAWCSLALLSGCAEKNAPAVPAPAATPPASALPPAPPPGAAVEKRAATPAAAQQPTATASRSILGRTTQEVRDADHEEAAGADRIEQPRITGQDYITVTGSAYSVIIGRSAILVIEHAVDLFHAEKGRYPKDLDEFMREIIKANQIRLPQLPAHQKYGYDAEQHKLVILEYAKQ